MVSRGWWEARGKLYTYRAVQVSSSSWHLMVFGDTYGLEAELTYPETFGDCKYYAGCIESGRYKLENGTAVRVPREKATR